MFTAIFVIILEYLSIITINSPYAISVISLSMQLFKTISLMYIVARYFDLSLFKLFPAKIIFKIIFPSLLLLLIEHYILVEVFNLGFLITLILSFIIYMLLYLGISRYLRIDYASIIKPLLRNSK